MMSVCNTDTIQYLIVYIIAFLCMIVSMLLCICYMDFSMVGCIMVMFMQWTWRIVVMSCRTCVNILVLNSHHRKTRGMGAGRKLKTHRRNQRWADKAYKKSHLGNEWKKPFAGSSHAKGIVLEKMYVSHGNDLCFYYLVLYVLGLRCVASIV